MLHIQFDFNPTTSEVTNLVVKSTEINKDDATVIVQDNKLQLSKSAADLIGASFGDRVTVNYYTVSPEETFPVIGKSDLFTDASGGNRLTKSNTVSFRGSQRDILLEYGKFFKLEPFKKYFKMVKIKEDSEKESLKEEELDLENLDKEI
jgi:hypothetical protein